MSAPRVAGAAALAALLGALLASPGAARGAVGESAAPPPSPYVLLAPRLLDTPPVDAIPSCLPSDVERDLGARRASERPALRQVAARLRALRGRAGPGRLGACAHLELARLEIRLGRFPEAAAEARRARALAEPIGDAAPLREGADFFRAEALYLSGWRRAADPIFRALARSERPPTAAAARLRVADIVFDEGDRASVLHDYETLLKRAADYGASLDGWGLRVSEAALAAGRYAAAAQWAARFVDEKHPAAVRSLVGIRLADVAALSGSAEDGRERLAEVERREPSGARGTLARVRAVDLGIDPRRPGERLATLLEATRSESRALSLYARGVLVHELRELGEIDRALAHGTRLIYEAPPARIAPRLAGDVEDLLVEVAERAERAERADGGDCPTLIRRLGGRYALLVHHVDSFRPWLALGRCYEAVGLPSLARLVYRALTRASGGEAAERLALPLARTALAAGDTGVVRTAAAGHIRLAGAAAFEWLLLLGEAERVDGRRDRAADLLRGLVKNGQPSARPLDAVLAFARTVHDLPESAADRALLSRSVETLPKAERERDPAAFGEAALLAAELERRASRGAAARLLYARAVAALPPGPGRAGALYWAGVLDRRPDSAGRAWQRAVDVERGGPWRRLAGFEVRMAGLRDQLGARP